MQRFVASAARRTQILLTLTAGRGATGGEVGEGAMGVQYRWVDAGVMVLFDGTLSPQALMQNVQEIFFRDGAGRARYAIVEFSPDCHVELTRDEVIEYTPLQNDLCTIRHGGGRGIKLAFVTDSQPLIEAVEIFTRQTQEDLYRWQIFATFEAAEAWVAAA